MIFYAKFNVLVYLQQNFMTPISLKISYFRLFVKKTVQYLMDAYRIDFQMFSKIIKRTLFLEYDCLSIAKDEYTSLCL